MFFLCCIGSGEEYIQSWPKLDLRKGSQYDDTKLLTLARTIVMYKALFNSP